jgi:glycosyltransferase involved in cell wall biosynthesis
MGGAQGMLLRLVERLQGQFEQYVVSLTNCELIGRRIAALGVPVEELGISRAFPNPLVLVKMVLIIRRLRPTIVQTWMYHADLLGGLASRLAGVQALVWNVRNNDPKKIKRLTRWVVSLCARLSWYIPTRIVSCSQAAVNTHIKLGYDPNKFIFIPNGFDISVFKPDESARKAVRDELGIPQNSPIVGLIARFDPQKNHSLFFAAASLLHRRRPEVHFLLAGRGVNPGNEKIVRQIQEAGVVKVTHLLGERNDIPRIMAALDIATLCSWSEAFPNVLGEAMACGVPCVATDVGDASLIVGDTGRIVPRDDPAALAHAWEELLSLPVEERQALSRKARARIAEHFEIGTIAERYAALYRELAKKGGDCCCAD